jgi:hypothetical protein
MQLGRCCMQVLGGLTDARLARTTCTPVDQVLFSRVHARGSSDGASARVLLGIWSTRVTFSYVVRA